MWTIIIPLAFSALVKKYNQVMQRYYIQYLSGYDAAVLNQHILVCHDIFVFTIPQIKIHCFFFDWLKRVT